MEVGGHLHIGRPLLILSDVIGKYMKEKGVKIEEELNRRTWSLTTRCTDSNRARAEEEEER